MSDVGPFPSDLFAVLARRLPPPLVDRAAERIRRRAIGDLSPRGLRPPPDGLYERLLRTGMIPTTDGRFIEALRAGRIKVVPAVQSLDRAAVILADGDRLEADAVVAATGYRRRAARRTSWDPGRGGPSGGARTEYASACAGPSLHRLHRAAQRQHAAVALRRPANRTAEGVALTAPGGPD
jgi:cation diffusion facilitator CzcD-associated flavoprotein CzcO